MRDNPKIIGLLGGMSWPSTVSYYQKINHLVQCRLGGSHSARILIWSDDYEIVEQMQLRGQWEKAGEWLAESAVRLSLGGAQLLGIACNTMHKVSSSVRTRVNLPLVDLIEVATREAASKGSLRTALLGTRFTVSMGRYSEELSKHGIGCVLPSLNDQEKLDEIIYKELCLGTVRAESRKALGSVMCRLVERGADTIMLACTELGLLIGETSADGATIIDTTDIHVRSLVEASLGE